MNRSKKNIAIFHYMPLEGYPPIQNLLKLERLDKVNIYCVTTQGSHDFKYQSPLARILRFGTSDSKGRLSSLKRYFSYLTFNFFGLVFLFLKRPAKILYYESISSFAPLIYNWLFPEAKLFILYHEYTSKGEYSNGPFLVKLFHRFEVKRYDRVCWISHTNNDRRELFSNDYGVNVDKIEILPNYPPKSWLENKTNNLEKKAGVKLVYVGYTLDNHSMFVDEIFEIIGLNKNLTLDLYLLKTPNSIVKNFEQEKFSNRVNWHNGLAYNELPEVLKGYDIGLILYKGITQNYKYNAPNKLFEYLACGLNVWYPKTMLGVKKYRSGRVVEIDFDNLETFNLDFIVSTQNHNEVYNQYTSENAFIPLINKLIA